MAFSNWPTVGQVGFAQPDTGGQTLTEERTDELEGEDRERFSHYVPKDKLTEAMVTGSPVVALCGKVWVPSRDPERYPVCPECKDIWEQMKGNDGDNGPNDGDGQ